MHPHIAMHATARTDTSYLEQFKVTGWEDKEMSLRRAIAESSMIDKKLEWNVLTFFRLDGNVAIRDLATVVLQ